MHGTNTGLHANRQEKNLFDASSSGTHHSDLAGITPKRPWGGNIHGDARHIGRAINPCGSAMPRQMVSTQIAVLL
ncbi:MAG: hypothetical protein NVSMB42_01420 [Herpetosiphon sp.]